MQALCRLFGNPNGLDFNHRSVTAAIQLGWPGRVALSDAVHFARQPRPFRRGADRPRSAVGKQRVIVIGPYLRTRRGCEIVGPIGKLETALRTVKDGGFDIAILDVTIRGGKVYPVAEELIARGVPFIFAIGYGDSALPPTLREKRRLTKPLLAELEEQVRLLFSEAVRSRESS